MTTNRPDCAAIEFSGSAGAERGNWKQGVRRFISFSMLAALASVIAPSAWGDISVTKSFSPAVIAVGSSSTLTIVIANSPPPGGTGSISFTDVYPANLTNAATPAASSDCGGTVTAVAGGTSLDFSGGSLNGNNVCTVTVTVTSAVAGSYLNSTGTVTTTNAGNAVAATATLTVTAFPPDVAKSFSPGTIALNGISLLTITLTNTNAVPITGAAFIDTYPANIKNTATPGLTNTCGGTATAAANGTSLALSGGTVAAGGSCSLTVQVTATASGSHINTTGPVTTNNVGTGAAATAALTVPSATTPGSFNAFETGTAAGATTGVIRTRIAGNPFSLDVVAISAGAQASTFNNAVRVELLGNTTTGIGLDGNNCPASATLLQTVSPAPTISGGRSTVSFTAVSNAWKDVRVRISYPAISPSVVSCSTDNFAIRPASLGSVTASDADSVTAGSVRTLDNTAASGGIVHRAGRPFRMAATAYNAASAATTNYAGTPVASVTACVLPVAGCIPGVLTPGTWAAVSGTVTTTTARYSEVGAFAVKLADASFAVVDASDGSTLAERTIESAVFNVGRFVPDHFELTTASTPQFKTFNDTACATRSFTYAGQPFGYLTLPQATITAKDAAGATTLNYAGALWKLAPAGVTQTYSAATGALDTGLVGTPAVNATGSGVGSLIADAADVIAFVRTTPVVPFTADISLSMSIQDSAENGVAGNGVIDTATPALFSGMAFDAGNEIRFGQLVVSNAHGSELLNLPVPIETRFWNGSGFVRNTVDSCTQLAAAHVALSGWQRDLNACETSGSLSGRFNAGRGNLRFVAPGSGNTGSVDLSLQLGTPAAGSACVAGAATAAVTASQSWLQGRSSGGAYDQNPVARASFGLYRGSKSLIYLREMY
jgi:MSHA biogenesis protein MshQ